MYDLVGDIHGHVDTLLRLLDTLGYRPRGGGFRHPSRQVIFLGDFIDRGPKILETLAIVRSMVESGAALAVMGNHEFNALAFHTPHPDRPGEYLRGRGAKNIHQHQATLDQVPPGPLQSYLDWFRTLPLFLDLDGLRVVHACWDSAAKARLETARQSHGGVNALFLTEAVRGDGPLFHDIETVLKGPEAELPAGRFFVDPDGSRRTAIRARWYLPAEGRSYRSYALHSHEVDCDDALTADAITSSRPYPADAKPVFIGHYWLRADRPGRLTSNVACVDYSVAKGGYLCAYRWDGEREIDDAKFVLAEP